ncbi:hypothetical protein JI747_006490 [Chryseobacterium sp. RG1]|uniref:Glycosyltransferase RgtA/B/C/D-like domain-containing protein n=1 Tax=Chryseobacterium tagetis TaxID=2801334 RepID=A0ABS7ZYL3_9FLAO|nr:hypothetical protein [Chryseobacterium tagetis]MCA6066817.1 hypothetical protein [Chryseobacterium tagetis]
MKKAIWFLLFALLFFLNTQFNTFHLIPKEKFEYSKLEESETLVIGKIMNSEHGKIMDDGGFTGTYYFKGSGNGRSIVGKQVYEKYIRNEAPEKTAYDPYKTQIGGQAILYSLFDKTFGLDNAINLEIFRIFNSLSLSILLTLFLYWTSQKFNFRVSVITFLLLLPNYWLFLYGKSSWWCNWVYFLPFVYSLLFFEKNKNQSFKKYIFTLSFLFFLKFWFTGFEFITVFLICSSIPYIYYLFENKISFYWNFIWRHFIILTIPLLINISFLLYQFYLLTGNIQTGIYHLKDAFFRRSSSEYFYEKSQNYLTLLKKFHLDIITRYSGNSFINEDLTFIKVPFAVILLAGIVCSVYLYLKKIDRKLIFTTWFSITAPFSWFILFQQHAHIHKHIDFFIWYCPFLILIILLISLTLNSFLKTLK